MEALSNKFRKVYDTLSRYSQSDSYYNKLFDKYITETGSHLRTDTSYTLYQVEPGDSFDSIALKFYDNPTYYWVLLEFNRLIDSFADPIPGLFLKIPEISKIEFE